MRHLSRTTRIHRLLLMLALSAALTAAAVERIELHVADITGPAWRAEDVTLSMTLTGRGPDPSGTISVGRLRMGPPVGTVDDLRIHCPALRLRAQGLDCPDGLLRLTTTALGAQKVPISLALAYDGRAISLTLPRLTLSYNGTEGRLAAADLRVHLALELRARDDGWRFTLEARAEDGQAYVDPVFVDLGAHPARLSARGRLRDNMLEADRVTLRQPGVIEADGALKLDLATGTVTSLALNRFEAQMPGAYTGYAQPFLIGSPLASLETAGTLSGALRADGKGLKQLRLAGRDLRAVDRAGRFRIEGAAIEAEWSRNRPVDAAPVSTLRWASAGIYRIDLGAAALHWRSAGDDLVLERSLRVPLLGGALSVETLDARDLAGATPTLAVEASLDPISLEQLSRAFGWPVLRGRLAGGIPALTYRAGNIELAGGLDATVFDGRVRVDRLRLENLFGARPRIALDATARGLDLALVTGAFSFGRIEGRLDADVENLRMLGWQPVAFDAWLRTPEGDDSRHRISQRAVDSIASLGGGAGLVSRGFLRFFDAFAYDRIGLGCRLRQGVCHMRGLGPAEGGGYVIVRGKWLPRIDVIGHTREVSWPTLLEQLRQATESQGPVVQ